MTKLLGGRFEGISVNTLKGISSVPGATNVFIDLKNNPQIIKNEEYYLEVNRNAKGVSEIREVGKLVLPGSNEGYDSRVINVENGLLVAYTRCSVDKKSFLFSDSQIFNCHTITKDICDTLAGSKKVYSEMDKCLEVVTKIADHVSDALESSDYKKIVNHNTTSAQSAFEKLKFPPSIKKGNTSIIQDVKAGDAVHGLTALYNMNQSCRDLYSLMNTQTSGFVEKKLHTK